MKQRKWQRHLTEREAAQIARLDAKLKKIDETRAILRAQRQRIQNRATARAGK